jgi:translation elongation factor EF-1alpha
VPWLGVRKSVDRDEPAPAPTAAPPLEFAPGPLPPSPDAPRIRVQDVYHVTGIGTVVVGHVENGPIRPPVDVRMVRANGGPVPPHPLRVTSAQMHHKEQVEVGPGADAGFTVQGFPPGRTGAWPLRRGDYLVVG